jgi:hypothetical protein
MSWESLRFRASKPPKQREGEREGGREEASDPRQRPPFPLSFVFLPATLFLLLPFLSLPFSLGLSGRPVAPSHLSPSSVRLSPFLPPSSPCPSPKVVFTRQKGERSRGASAALSPSFFGVGFSGVFPIALSSNQLQRNARTVAFHFSSRAFLACAPPFPVKTPTTLLSVVRRASKRKQGRQASAGVGGGCASCWGGVRRNEHTHTHEYFVGVWANKKCYSYPSFPSPCLHPSGDYCALAALLPPLPLAPPPVTAT